MDVPTKIVAKYIITKEQGVFNDSTGGHSANPILFCQRYVFRVQFELAMTILVGGVNPISFVDHSSAKLFRETTIRKRQFSSDRFLKLEDV